MKGRLCGLLSRDRAREELVSIVRQMTAADGRETAIQVEQAGSMALASRATSVDRGACFRATGADGQVLVVADVRLDNRNELAHDLGIEGPTAHWLNDPEIVLAAYLEWGEQFPQRLLGDFAVAVWDGRLRRLLLTVDSLGIEGLCYARFGADFVFASAAHQLLRHPASAGDLDETSIADHLAGNFPDPERTFFRHIRRLPPAHILSVSEENSSLRRYWDVDLASHLNYRRDEEYFDHARELLQQCVADRMPPDQPVAVVMSGGLDSCSVAALGLAIRKGADSGMPLFACSLRFPHLPECDEGAYIRCMEEELGITVAAINTRRLWFLGDETCDQPSLEEPFMAWQSCYDAILRAARNRGARVLLTGLGGDDLFFGGSLAYADRLGRGDLRVVAEVLAAGWRRKDSSFRLLYRYLVRPFLAAETDALLRRLAGANGNGADVCATVPIWVAPGLARRTHLAQRLAAATEFASPRRTRGWIYNCAARRPGFHEAVRWFARHAAPAGAEVRHPFLDRRLLEFVLRIPERLLFEIGRSKLLLREAMAGLLPEKIRQRSTKTRLGPFIDYSLRERARHRVEELFRSSLAVDLGFLEPDGLQTALRAYLDGTPRAEYRHLWAAITLELWLRRLSGAASHSVGMSAGKPTSCPQPMCN